MSVKLVKANTRLKLRSANNEKLVIFHPLSNTFEIQ
jgi:hypothetical protein